MYSNTYSKQILMIVDCDKKKKEKLYSNPFVKDYTK